MVTDTYQIAVSGMTVEVVRKPIKNLHLGVYPPHGQVRVAAPLALTKDAIRIAVVDKLSWIKRQKAKFEAQPRQSKREMISGESHYFFGRRYRLRVIESDGAGRVVLRKNGCMDLYVRPNVSTSRREQILLNWYRDQLKKSIPPLLQKWQKVVGVRVNAYGVRRMKTKWGSCKIDDRRILLNLELAKKPLQCLEYIIVHELVHLLEQHHNDRFAALMDKYMPAWPRCRNELNSTPLCHEKWIY